MKHYENSLKQLALTVHGPIFGRAYYREGFCIGGFGRLILGRAYFFFFGGGGLIIGILVLKNLQFSQLSSDKLQCRVSHRDG